MVSIENIILDYEKCKSSTDVANKYSMPQWKVYDILRKNSVDTTKSVDVIRNKATKYLVNHDYFETIDTEEKAYILGLLFADGNVSKTKSNYQVKLKLSDLDLLNKVKNIITPESKLYYDKCAKETHKLSASMIVTSSKMANDLIKLGCCIKKSLVLEFPKIDDLLYRHFVRGYFDGDGSIYVGYRKDRNSFYAEVKIISAIGFCNTVSKILTTEGIVNCIRMDNRLKQEFTKFINITSPNNIIKLYHFMYDDSNIYLSRKREKFLNYFNKIGYGDI